jgi:NAD(P)-dependent dehydrogenase (short-subunit alcohol dehydrogenase family)
MDPSDLIRLDGRAVLVAGAGGGGIGTAVCVAVARAGGTVVAVDRDEGGRRTAAAALAGAGGANERKHLVLGADLADPAQVDDVVQRAGDEVGPLRGSVHVVGGMRREHWGPLDSDDALETVDDLLAFNLRPALVGARAVARSMHASNQPGSIVAVASAAALSAMPFGAGYAAAKSARVSLVRTMAVEWGRRGTRVNAVAPGSIRVHRHSRERADTSENEQTTEAIRTAVPLGRRGEPDEVANAIVFLLSDLSSYVTGHTLVVDGGAHCRAPYADADDLPVFVTDPALRSRLTLD